MKTLRVARTTAIASALLTLSTVAFAATPGFFVGLGAGYAKQDMPSCELFSDAVSTSDTYKTATDHSVGGLSGTAFAGYNFNQYFGLEASYNQYAGADYKSVQATSTSNSATASIDQDASSINLVAKGYLKLDNKLDMIFRGGAAYVRKTVDYKNTDGTDIAIPVNPGELATPDLGDHSYNAFRPTVGLGFAYNITDHVIADFTYNYILGKGDLKKDKDAIPNIQMLTFNLTYTFG